MNNLDKMFSSDAAAFSSAYIDYVCRIMKSIDVGDIARFVDTLLDARERGASIFFIGNGGSSATASHFVNDLTIGTQSYETPFKAFCLSDNQPIVTAVANDFGYDEIFVRQMKIYAKPGDVLVGISASGNSKNVVDAFKYARSIDVKTVAITAFDGGMMREIASEGIHVQTDDKEYGPAEDAHMVLDHLVVSYLVRAVGNA